MSRHGPSRSRGAVTPAMLASVGAIDVVSTGNSLVCGFTPGHQKMIGTAVSWA